MQNVERFFQILFEYRSKVFELKMHYLKFKHELFLHSKNKF
jgi:hypothetical protein